MSTTDDSEPTTTAIDSVFERLIKDIVSGHFASGARLPAERELSRNLGASRPTLREALRRLGEWNLVEPRRGSGVVVRPWREWSIEVLPSYLRYAKPTPGQPTLARMMLDMIALRKLVLVELIREAANRLKDIGTAAPRSALARTWGSRHDQGQFAREEMNMVITIMEAARFTPGLWLMNRIAFVYNDVVGQLGPGVFVPDDYIEHWTKVYSAMDQGDGDTAAVTMREWLDRTDRAIIKALELAAG